MKRADRKSPVKVRTGSQGASNAGNFAAYSSSRNAFSLTQLRGLNVRTSSSLGLVSCWLRLDEICLGEDRVSLSEA